MKHVINITDAIMFIFCASCVTFLLYTLNSDGVNGDIMFSLWVIILPVVLCVFYIGSTTVLVILLICLCNITKYLNPLPIENDWDWLIHLIPIAICGGIWEYRANIQKYTKKKRDG